MNPPLPIFALTSEIARVFFCLFFPDDYVTLIQFLVLQLLFAFPHLPACFLEFPVHPVLFPALQSLLHPVVRLAKSATTLPLPTPRIAAQAPGLIPDASISFHIPPSNRCNREKKGKSSTKLDFTTTATPSPPPWVNCVGLQGVCTSLRSNLCGAVQSQDCYWTPQSLAAF